MFLVSCHDSLKPSSRTFLRITIFLLAVCLLLSPEHSRGQRAGSSPKAESAETLFKEAEVLASEWNEPSLRKAIEGFKAARNAWRSLGNRHGEIQALNAEGEVLISLSEYQPALRALKESLSLSTTLSDQSESLNGLSSVYLYLGDQKKALTHCEQAYRLSQKASDSRVHAQSLVNLGDLSYFQGKNQKALQFADQALSLWPDPGWRGRARALINKGYAYFDLRDIDQALAHYQQSLEQSRSQGNRRDEALALTAIGGVYSYLGNKKAALEFQNQAVTLFRTVGDRNGEGVALNGLGYVYRNLGEHKKSLDCYLRAMQLFEVLGNREYEAFTSTRVGKAYEGLGDTVNALRYYRLALNRAVNYPQTRAQALNSIGNVLESAHETEQALTYYKGSLAIFLAAGDRMGEASILNSVGRLYSVSGQRSRALDSFKRALVITREVRDRREEISVLLNIAQLERDAGNYDKARRTIEESLSIIESLRTEVASTNLRASYFASVRQHHELYIDILMQLDRSHPSAGFAAEAFTACERARARSLLELLGEAQAGIRQGVDAALLEQERKLQQDLNEKAERHMKLVALKETEQATELAREIDQLTNQYDQLEVKIRSMSPRFAAFREPKPLSLSEVQQQVLGRDDDSILLEYSLGDKRSYLWAVTRSEVSSFELPSRTTIEGAARNVYNGLTAGQPIPGESFAERQARVAKANQQLPSQIAELSNLILAPVASKLGTKRVLIVSDGALQYIPFQVLSVATTQGTSGLATSEAADRFLMADHEIVNEPSASALALLLSETTTRKPASKSVAVLADPVFEIDDPRLRLATRANLAPVPNQETALQRAVRDVGIPGEGFQISRLLSSREEAEAIMAEAPWWSGFKATDFEANREMAMRSDLGNYRIVHFATHGLLNNEHPDLSGVVLSLYDQNGQPQDGFLRLHDIYNLKLPVDLVVLSACNTALGKDVRGEGLVGLTRGFMYAGASSVVASLWKVDDEATAELMRHFYKFMLRDGLAPAAALRKAQLEMSKQKRWQSPYYWAGFIIQGQYIQRQPTNTPSISRMALGISVAAIFALALFFVLQQRRRKFL